MRPTGPWMHYGITAFIKTTPGTGRSHIHREHSTTATKIYNLQINMRPLGLVNNGAWADSSGWKGVYDILVKDGYNVSIVQEPKTSFKEEVAASKRTLRSSRRTVHSCRSQLWGSRNYRSWDGSIGCRIGVHRSPHTRRRRERGGRWKALPKRPQQVWCDKEDHGRFHLHRTRAVS
jgi:hypothetical protein